MGCDVVETCTFQSTPRRLTEWGLGDKVDAINVGAAQARARRVRQSSRRPSSRASSPARWAPPACSRRAPTRRSPHITFADLAENYYQQAKGLVEGGVDVLLIETSQDILEVKAAIAGIERLFAELGRRVALQAQVTLDTSGRMLLGTDIASAMTTLEALGVDVIGLNCSTGPEHMREPIRYLGEHARLPISVIPNAGLPLNTGVGDAVYPLEPAPMARRAGGVRARLRRAHRRRMLRHDAASILSAIVAAVIGRRTRISAAEGSERRRTSRASRRRCARSRCTRIRRRC